MLFRNYKIKEIMFSELIAKKEGRRYCILKSRHYATGTLLSKYNMKDIIKKNLDKKIIIK